MSLSISLNMAVSTKLTILSSTEARCFGYGQVEYVGTMREPYDEVVEAASVGRRLSAEFQKDI